MATYRPSRRDDFHVAVICALPLEYDAAVLACDEIWGGLEDDLGKAAQDPNTYTLGRIGKHNVVLVLLSGMGKVNAASATSSLRSSYRELRLALLCGICGGVPSTDGTNEVLLGDVIISNSVVQYDLGRQYPDQFAPKDTIGDSLGRPTKEIRSLLIGFETHRKRQELQRQVSQNLAEVQRKAVKDGYDVDYSQPRAEDVLFQPDYLHRHRKQQQCGCSETHICDTAARTPCVELKCDVGHQVHRKRLQSQGEQQAPVKSQRPRVFVGQIGSGDTVMKSGQHRDSIAREHSLVAFEMEGAGVWDEMPCIIVKGVCDYADSHKNKDWQHYAAATAASATKALLGQFASTSTFDARVVENKILIVPYVENPDFVGRDIILDRIKQQFGHAQSQNEATLKPRTRLALQGLGGVGKTQIALAYVYWLREAYPELSVLWVHASNHQRFRQAFTAIAQECNIPGHNDASADILSLVKEWLENKQSGRWLLVIDNADDKDLFLPPNAEENDVGADAQSMTSQGGLGRYVPDCAHGSVLITTRNKQAGLGLTRGHSPIEVKKMTDPEAHQLLCSLLGNDDISPKDTVLLAYRLEYLPLALAQAASFILMNSLSIDEYVQLLDKSDSSFVRQLSTYFETVGRDSDTPHALTATWTISFNQIEQRHPLASKILSLISIFDRQAIPGEFVLRSPKMTLKL
ncbi:kinesin light chain [Colletotrichum tofieldiae]|nr:kinesin light chain [Colletotrichum tofieldiae]